MSCCRNKRINSDLFHSVKDRYHEREEDDDPFSFPSELLDGHARASFEVDEVAIPMELTEVYRQLLAHESLLATPPEEVIMTILDLLTSMRSDDDFSTFCKEKNNAIDCLLTYQMPSCF